MPFIQTTAGSLTESGFLAVEDRTPLRIGAAVQATITTSAQELDLTQLVVADDYPMVVELEARDAACYVKQGPTGVTMAGIAPYGARINADEWRVVNVDSTLDAYVTVSGVDATSGTLVATRIDALH